MDAVREPSGMTHAPDDAPREAAPVPTPHAGAAVEATLAAIERIHGPSRSSVELHLSVGDHTPLSVRVELRDGIIHTTFRTDSAELRHALTREWNVAAPALSAGSADRPVHIAEPAFVASAGSFDSATDFRDGQRPAHPPTAPEPVSPAGRLASRPIAAADPVPQIPAPASTKGRLLAFA